MKTSHSRTLDKDGLSLREALFCRCYAINRSSSAEAAREAGYSGDLRHRASELLKRPRIQTVITRLRDRLMKKAELKAERVLEELKCIAGFRINRLFGPDGKILPVNQWGDATSAAISSIDFRDGRVCRVRTHSKIQALDLLGRYLKLWDGAGNAMGDRLKEVISAFEEGPVETETIQ